MAEGDRRTFSSYKTEVMHSIGNPTVASMSVSAGDIVNDALEHIANLHAWNWKTTGHQVLSITGGQDYVELPEDFGALIALDYDRSWSNSMSPVSWPVLLSLRAHANEPAVNGYCYTINIGNVEAGSEEVGLTLATLNLYPTPQDSIADIIPIVYRRFLRRLVSVDDRPQWPAYIDRPLSLLSRGFASTDYDDNPESAYTTEFRSLIGDCIANDGLAIPSFGQMQGGATQQPQASQWGFPVNGIPNPS